jgi:putative DNA primase/helicase
VNKRVIAIDDYEREAISAAPANTLKIGDGETYEANEDGIALAFAEQYENHLLFDHSRGRWFVWTGDHWQIEETDLAFDYARTLAREFRKKQSTDKSLTKMRLPSEVERAARSDRRLVARHEDWDADPLMLGVPSGAVDLRTGELLPPDPNLMISRQAAVPPAAPGTPPPMWSAFLNEATGRDQELIRFLQMWCGYCLTGSTAEHALCFVYGPGGNGKSVFINTLTGILGDYAATAAMDTFTAKHFEGHSTDIAALAGARLVVASETEEGKAWAEARLKQLTGGDAITARFMRQDNFTFRPQFKLTITGNYQPTLQSAEPAMQRRLNIVPFTRTPAKPDKQLEDKLRAEWPAILRWMIEGCLAWQENGLSQPEAVKVATAEYFSEQDLFGQWLDECCEVEQGNEYKHEKTSDLYKSYSTFVKDRGEFPLTSKAWGGQMRKRLFTAGNSRSKGGRYYEGIILLRSEALYND